LQAGSITADDAESLNEEIDAKENGSSSEESID
jgi:hypothetical protein